MTTQKQKKPTITDSSMFKTMNKKGTFVIDAGRADRKLNIPNATKVDKEFLFLNPFTDLELHPEDWNDIITADMGGTYREKKNL